MNLLSLFSFVVLVAASPPPLYFALRLRGSNPAFSALSLVMAAALMVHGIYHLLEFVEIGRDVVLGTEAVSALLIIAFALAYWPLRGRR